MNIQPMLDAAVPFGFPVAERQGYFGWLSRGLPIR